MLVPPITSNSVQIGAPARRSNCRSSSTIAMPCAGRQGRQAGSHTCGDVRQQARPPGRSTLKLAAVAVDVAGMAPVPNSMPALSSTTLPVACSADSEVHAATHARPGCCPARPRTQTTHLHAAAVHCQHAQAAPAYGWLAQRDAHLLVLTWWHHHGTTISVCAVATQVWHMGRGVVGQENAGRRDVQGLA